MRYYLTGAVVVLLLLVAVHGDDQILSLPGINSVSFKQYAGYINVNVATGRNLFYWFVESQSNPATSPVVLWLNGGPGCSSLSGLFEELGPFYPVQDTDGNITLEANPYSWNLIANVIFLESPSGVGFSYSTNTSDYTVGDTRTANDSYTFLLQFFKQYPQFSKNPFWVTGESYGGHYVPMLSQRILEGNQQNGPLINFQGFMVGNPWTDPPNDNTGTVLDWWSHALISDETFADIEKYCDFYNKSSSYNPDACNNAQNTASNEMGNIDPYDIYTDVCLAPSVRQLRRQIAASGSKLSTFSSLAARQDEPCIDDYLTTYLNQPQVKLAIHAKPSILWDICSETLDYSSKDSDTSMLPVYEVLLKKQITIVVYSGDVDSVVPVVGTRLWLAQLQLPILEPWRPWTGSSGQVGGYTVKYKGGVTFLTIRNAGHLVPGTQPQRALDFFSRLLFGKPL